MTNFILQNPNAVFIHLPKTGGTSVRKALNSSIHARFFGHIPQQHAPLPHFSVIRDPKQRFLSAYRMFKYGNVLKGDHYAAPRWPDLTISQALDVLEDPWIGYDRSHRTLEWNFKHHLIPQTHPFNCLALAKTVLRFEHLSTDFARLCRALGVSAELPKLRRSLKDHAEHDAWKGADIDRFMEIFKHDYKYLRYKFDPSKQADTAPIYNLVLTETSVASVYDQWPSYFSDEKIFAADAPQALPATACHLEVFADEIIPGSPDETWAGRSRDLIAHFRKLQPEFAGASRLSHLLACCIVTLRKAPDCQAAHSLFWRILDEQFDVIRSELSLRWLVAISDTIADFGRDPGEIAIGLNASVFANTTKLHESELKVFYPKRPWPPKKRLSTGGPLFDGMLTFWTEKGDMIDNMFTRATKTAALSPTAGKVLMEVIERLRKGPTVYNRFSRIAGAAQAPVLEDDTKRRLQRIMTKKL